MYRCKGKIAEAEVIATYITLIAERGILKIVLNDILNRMKEMAVGEVITIGEIEIKKVR